MINKGPFNNWVCVSYADVTQFSDLEIAKRHGELNAPASIFRGSDVTSIQTLASEAKMITAKFDAWHVWRTW